MSELVNPHGSKNLKPLLVYGIERRELLNKAKQLKKNQNVVKRNF